VITFDPHPRVALGNRVELIATLERRLELIAAAGVEATLVASFTPELQALEPELFAERYLRAIGAEAVAAGADFRSAAGAPATATRSPPQVSRSSRSRRWTASRRPPSATRSATLP
jgi:riboflavin kinase/FMN adenylyltransferase